MNLRALATASTGFALISAIVAAKLWQDLHSERQLTAALQTKLAGSTGQLRAVPVDTGIDARIVAPLPDAVAPPAAVATQTASTIPIATAQIVDSSEQELLKDPAYRKALLQASTYANALAREGAPLDNAQIRHITIVIRDEQESLRQDIVELARGVDLTNPQSQALAQNALKKRQEESGQHVLDAASPRLTAQQVALFRDQLGK